MAMAGRKWLEEMDARLKIILLVLAILLLVWLPLGYSVFFFIAAIAIMSAGGISAIGYVKKNAALVIFCLAPLVIRLFIEQSPAYLAGYLVPLGLVHGAQNSLYLLSILLFAHIFIETTAPFRAKEALSALGMPKRYAMMLAISFGYRRYIEEKVKKARLAQAARGVKNNAFSLLVPTLNSSFSRSKTLALTLASRGFTEE